MNRRRLKVAAFVVSICMPVSMGGLAPTAHASGSSTVTRTAVHADSTRSTSAFQWPHDMPRPSLKKRAKRLNRAQRTIGGVHGKLRHKKPRHTKRYKRRLARKLRKAHKRLRTAPRFDWFGCSVSVAQFIMSNGFTPAKIYRVVKSFKTYFGSAKATLKAASVAFRTGDWKVFIVAAGDEGPEIIQAFFGAGDLMDRCF